MGLGSLLRKIKRRLTGEWRYEELERRLDKLEAKIDRVLEALGNRGMERRFKDLEAGVASVVRKLYVEPSRAAETQRLPLGRFRILSQNGEDGIVYAIFAAIGDGGRRAVEIGSGPNGGNSGFLVGELGWTGLFVDVEPREIERLRSVVSRKRATLVCASANRETINDLIAKNGFDGEIDLLSIDVDGNDYWLWDALTAARPRVVIVEFNSTFGPDRAVTIAYDGTFHRHKLEKQDRFYFGASLGAFVKLAGRKGYRLVAVEPRGVNAFFVREDLGAGVLPTCDPRDAYRLLDKYEPKVAGADVVEDLRSRGFQFVEV